MRGLAWRHVFVQLILAASLSAQEAGDRVVIVEEREPDQPLCVYVDDVLLEFEPAVPRENSGEPPLREKALPLKQSWRITDASLNRRMFGNAQAGATQKRFDTILTNTIDSIDWACVLTDSQQEKLELAGRGDIQRWFDRVEEVRRKFQTYYVDEKDRRGLARFADELSRDTAPLGTMAKSGPCAEGSLFAKVMQRLLTVEQLADYGAIREINRLGGDVKKEERGLAQVDEIRFGTRAPANADLVHIRRVESLQRLILDSARVTDSGLVHLAGLKSLKVLGLGKAQLNGSGLVHLKGLTELETLDLRSTDVTDAGLAHAGRLTRLKHLNLYRTQVTDAGLANLANLKHLQSLQLGWTLVTDAGIGSLQRLDELSELRLNGTDATDSALGLLTGLNKLEILDLRATRVTDAGLSQLKNMRNLTTLELSGSDVTPAGIADLRRALPKLKIEN